MTRKLVMYNQVSADGFFADERGDVSWVKAEPELRRRAVAGMSHTDCLVFGRRTYDQFSGFWPGALRDLSAPGPHGESKHDASFAAMARWLNDTPKLVFSRSSRPASWGPCEVWSELDPGRVSALKHQPGKDLLLFGSGSIVSQLSEHGLIDEYRFVVCPLLLGRGKTLLGELPRRVGLQLTSAESFPSGVALLTYAPA